MIDGQAFIKPCYALLGALIGALIASVLTCTENIGLIGIGAVQGVSIGNPLYRRIN